MHPRPGRHVVKTTFSLSLAVTTQKDQGSKRTVVLRVRVSSRHTVGAKTMFSSPRRRMRFPARLMLFCTFARYALTFRSSRTTPQDRTVLAPPLTNSEHISSGYFWPHPCHEHGCVIPARPTHVPLCNVPFFHDPCTSHSASPSVASKPRVQCGELPDSILRPRRPYT